jgi:hypothetical protein
LRREFFLVHEIAAAMTHDAKHLFAVSRARRHDEAVVRTLRAAKFGIDHDASRDSGLRIGRRRPMSGGY